MGDSIAGKLSGIMCVAMFLIALPLGVGFGLFTPANKTCPDVWHGQDRFTKEYEIDTPNTFLDIDISSKDFSFSKVMRVVLNSKTSGYTNLTMTVTQNDKTMAEFNEDSRLTKTFDLTDRKSPLKVWANQKVLFDVTPIRQNCPKATGGAIVLLIAIELVIVAIIAIIMILVS